MLEAADRPAQTAASNAAGFVLPAVLPDDPAALKALLQAQQAAFAAEVSRQVAAQLAEQAKAFEARLLELYEKIRLARTRMFGPSSESHAGQGWLFNEVEALAEASPEAVETAPLLPPNDDPQTGEKPACARARGKRKPLLAELPRIEVIHEVPEAERTCACGTPMVEIGEQVSEQLDIVPMQVRVLRHIRKRYGCPKGDAAPVCGRSRRVVAPAPPAGPAWRC